MNEVECTVSDLMTEYGKGLEMTTQDVIRLEQELEQKRAELSVARRGRRRRIVQAAVAACAVTAVVLGGLALRDRPGAETPKPAVAPPLAMSAIAGMWREGVRPGGEPDGRLWTFTTQGLAIDDEPGRVLRLMLQPTHQLVLIPGGFTIADVDAPACTTTFATSDSQEGLMRVTVTSSAATGGRLCNLSKGESWDLVRVSPVSPVGASSQSVWPSRDRAPVTLLGQLTGTWVLAGTGKVVAVTGTGEYEIQDLGAPDAQQSGTVTVGQGGEVTFTPTDAPACPAVYERVTTTYNALDTLLKDGSCSRLNRSNDGWIRLN